MKFSLLPLALMASMGLHAQATALDFTAPDCDGVEHHLFADLDSGYCVVIDLVMMNCPSCGPATTAITNDVIPGVSDPSRVKFYSIGYTNSTTCAQMLDWRADLGLDHAVFAGMSDQTAWYGGMGMPTVIVTGGGAEHGVYYNHMGYNSAQASVIIGRINAALADALGIDERDGDGITLGPNPVSGELLLPGRWATARVVDEQGRTVLLVRSPTRSLDVSKLSSGSYHVQLTATEGTTAHGRFVKQ